MEVRYTVNGCTHGSGHKRYEFPVFIFILTRVHWLPGRLSAICWTSMTHPVEASEPFSLVIWVLPWMTAWSAEGWAVASAWRQQPVGLTGVSPTVKRHKIWEPRSEVRLALLSPPNSEIPAEPVLLASANVDSEGLEVLALGSWSFHQCNGKGCTKLKAVITTWAPWASLASGPAERGVATVTGWSSLITVGILDCRYTGSCLVLMLGHVWLFVNLWTVAHQAPLSMGYFQARIMEWVAMSSSRGSFQPRDLLCLLHCRQILYPLSFVWGGFVTHWA